MRYRLRTLLIVLAVGLLALAWRVWPFADEMLDPPRLIGQSTSPVPSDEPLAEPPPDPYRPTGTDLETPEGVQIYLKSNQIESSTLPQLGMKFDELVAILGEPTSRSRVQESTDGSEAREVPDPMGPIVQWYHNPKGMHVAPFIAARIEDGVAVWLISSRH